jgi:D-amino-acid dehydrogenase
MSKSVLVVGGGIIGLSSAYYLNKAGHHVTVVDQSNLDAGASYVNAGYLSPSHLIPLSAPGVMKKGLKWMFNPTSPLYIKPRFDLDFLRWSWAFNKSCNLRHVQKVAPVIRDISLLSQELMTDIKKDSSFTFHYQKKGLFMLCQTEKMLEEELEVAKYAVELGLAAKEVSRLEIQQMEPDVNINAIGAAYFECDHHSTPQEFMTELKAYLTNAGVSIYANEKVLDIVLKNQSVESVVTSNRTFKPDEIVMAAGSWSSLLAKKLGVKLLLQAGKGYRINTERETGIKIPAILAEAKAAVTPMNGFTRFAGTMEIAGINHDINKVRVEAIAKAATQYYPDVKLTVEEIGDAACGLRPVTPDGLPYIGKSKKCNNLTIAAGHAMMGWSMSTATGKLVSEIISTKKPSLNLEFFNPDRKF